MATFPVPGENLIALSSRLAESLEQQVAVPPEPPGLLGCDGENDLTLLGKRRVKLGDVVDQAVEIEGLDLPGFDPCFEPRDPQQRVEGLQQRIGFLDGTGDGAAIGLLVALVRERQLEAAAQPGKRTPQIVGNVVADLADARHQLRDAVEHVVEVRGQPVELVVRPARRDPPVERAGHDFPAGLVDRVDAAQHGPADQHAARDAEDQRERDPPADGFAEPGVDLQPLPDVAPDEKAEPPVSSNMRARPKSTAPR